MICSISLLTFAFVCYNCACYIRFSKRPNVSLITVSSVLCNQSEIFGRFLFVIMPSNVSSRLNDTVSIGFTAAEINGTTNPFLAVTFELQAGMLFNFRGIVAELATSQTAPGTFTFFVFGDEKLQVLPSDNFITLRNRGSSTESFYFSRADIDFTERHYSVRDLFPFQNQRVEPGYYTFFVGVLGTLNADIVVTLTVYGSVESITAKQFPWEQR